MIELHVGGLDAHQVAVGTRIAKCLIVLIVPLADAEGESDIHLFDALNDAAHACLIIVQVLARLHHNSPEADFHSTTRRLDQFVIIHVITGN